MAPMQVVETLKSSSLLARRKQPVIVSKQPSFALPDSQLVSASQIYEPDFERICIGFGGHVLDRKVWEYCYIVRALEAYADDGKLRGLCFGSGKERLPAHFASMGHEIVATDLPSQEAKDWQTESVEDLFHSDVIEREAFDERVTFRPVDMNNIPSDLTEFDFLWSTGTLEHIGSHANGLRFVEQAMDCLRPGGVAIHTTEFTVTSRERGYDTPSLSFYCRKDIEGLAHRLTEQGHQIVLNFERGDTLADGHVDVAPFQWGQGLAAHFQSHIITSIGLIIQKG